MKNTILLFILATGLWGCSSKPKTIAENGGIVIRVTADNIVVEKETSDSIVNILTRRFNNQYPDNNVGVRFDEVYQLFSIEIPGADTTGYSSALILATASGNFEVSEIFNPTELLKDIKSDSLYAGNDTLTLLKNYDIFTFGLLCATDTGTVNTFFNTPGIQNRLAGKHNIRMVWGEAFDKHYGDMEGMYPLYFLKKSAFNIPLGTACKEAKVEENIYKSFHISITLKKEYAPKFENLTRNNIGHPLAIVCDNTILSVPLVNDAITGGKLAITGHFEYENLLTLSSLLIGGQIDIPLKAIDIQKF